MWWIIVSAMELPSFLGFHWEEVKSRAKCLIESLRHTKVPVGRRSENATKAIAAGPCISHFDAAQLLTCGIQDILATSSAELAA